MKRNIVFRPSIVLALVLALGSTILVARHVQAQWEPGLRGADGVSSPQAAVGTSFIYQGQLSDGGSPANGDYDLEFALYDAESGGAQVGSTVTKEDVAVSEGLFTVELDFGSAFDGTALWLEIGVRAGSSTGAYTGLSPRQTLAAAPYAHSLRPGAEITGDSSDGATLSVLTSGSGGAMTSSKALYGHATSTTGNTFGVYGRTDSTDGLGVYGLAYASTGEAHGVMGTSLSEAGRGVYGYASSDSGVTYGVYGYSRSYDGRGVYGYASNTEGPAHGVYGQTSSTGGHGVYGYNSAGSGFTAGVFGETNSANGGKGVTGYATATSGGSIGVYGYTASSEGYAGYFVGDTHVQGTLSKSAGSFKIDHPLDPANQYLYHSFVESPDMMNIYNGNVILDDKGEAWVQLPDWFEALNGGQPHRSDFRYQLTPVGAAMPNLYVAQEIQDNAFRIAGGEPGMKVSWQVTGIRHDPYAEANRIPVEEIKPEVERGTYLYPELYGQPEELGRDQPPAASE